MEFTTSYIYKDISVSQVYKIMKMKLLGAAILLKMTGGEGWYRKKLRLPVATGESIDEYLK